MVYFYYDEMPCIDCVFNIFIWLKGFCLNTALRQPWRRCLVQLQKTIKKFKFWFRLYQPLYLHTIRFAIVSSNCSNNINESCNKILLKMRLWEEASEIWASANFQFSRCQVFLWVLDLSSFTFQRLTVIANFMFSVDWETWKWRAHYFCQIITTYFGEIDGFSSNNLEIDFSREWSFRSTQHEIRIKMYDECHT